MLLYVVFDKVGELAGEPFSAVNDGVALRGFSGMMAKLSAGSPEEYELWCVGSYDSSTMEIVPCHRQIVRREVSIAERVE